jgi:hypothetical protein
MSIDFSLMPNLTVKSTLSQEKRQRLQTVQGGITKVPIFSASSVRVRSSIIDLSLIYWLTSKRVWERVDSYVGRHCIMWRQGEMHSWFIWQRYMEVNVLFNVSMMLWGWLGWRAIRSDTVWEVYAGWTCMPILDGGNVGIRRRRWQALMMEAGYGPLSAAVGK